MLKPQLKHYTLTHLPGEKQRGLIQRDSKRSHHNELKKKTKQQRYQTNQGKGHDDALETLQVERSTSNFTSILCKGVLVGDLIAKPPTPSTDLKTKQNNMNTEKRNALHNWIAIKVKPTSVKNPPTEKLLKIPFVAGILLRERDISYTLGPLEMLQKCFQSLRRVTFVLEFVTRCENFYRNKIARQVARKVIQWNSAFRELRGVVELDCNQPRSQGLSSSKSRKGTENLYLLRKEANDTLPRQTTRRVLRQHPPSQEVPTKKAHFQDGKRARWNRDRRLLCRVHELTHHPSTTSSRLGRWTLDEITQIGLHRE